MKKLVIEGQHELTGEIKISGAKNSTVALIPAAILSDEKVVLTNVPEITDTYALIDIMKLLNCKIDFKDETMHIDPTNAINKMIPKKLSQKLRASYYFMGALLSKYKHVEMYFPGGCNIGARPINFHIEGFEKLGAKVKVEDDKYIIDAPNLIGTKIYINKASVGTTVNLMLAAVKAEGETVLSNAAKEPEIINIANMLNNMGAKISGAGTSEITITGVERLGSCTCEVIPDRIDAGNYLIAGALMGKNLELKGVIEEHMSALTSKLKEMGVLLDYKDNNLIISRPTQYKAVNVKTLVFPGFVTDLGQPMSVLLTQAEGTSVFEETIYENRMGHVHYLNEMGANIEVQDRTAIIKGKSALKGREVIATDLRAGASLVLAALCAEGTTTIIEIEHILRGYENIVEKLTNVGAKIKIVEE